MTTSSISAQIADLLGEESGRPGRASVADVLVRCPPGAVVAARDENGRDVAVAVTESGKSYIVADSCPHDGGALSTGFVHGNRLICARHGWEFDLDSGRCPHNRQVCVKSEPVG